MKSYVSPYAAVKPLSAPHRRRVHAVVSVLAVAVAVFIATPVASAQGQAAGQIAVQQFNVPAGDLSSALLMFGEQSGLQFNVDSTLTDGKRSNGVRGSYAVDRALIELLSGSGLSYRYSGPRTVVIEPATEVSDAHQLGPLRIGGSAGGGAGTDSSINGVNGSGDVTSTEGSGSFTSGALTVASKMPLSIKETAQSVSVVTHQQMVEQNITDFDTLMEYSPGIVTMTTGVQGPIENSYYSRGFLIQRVQIDGGAPMDISDVNVGLNPLFDMSIYDHAEILRGADGLFNGFGNAGGVIALQRKRPLDHFQLVVEGQAGSWDNYRTVVDVTGPLALNGRLRGRAVATFQDNHEFVDLASNRKELLFGTVDFDATPTTLLSLGFTRTLQDAVPFTSGLPRYRSGADLGLSRDTCLCVPWGSYEVDSTELFMRVEQLFGESWKLTANVTNFDQDSFIKYGSVSGYVNPVTLTGPTFSTGFTREASEQLTADLSLSGSFEWLGHTQLFVVSGMMTEADAAGKRTYTGLSSGTAVDVFNYDPYDPAYADNTDSALLSSHYPMYKKSQRMLAANLRLTLLEPLHLEFGMKYNFIEREELREGYCTVATGCTSSATGLTYAQGEMIGTYPGGYSDEEVNWPPAVKLIYDLNDAFTAYVSYTDIYQEQTTSIDFSGNSLEPITGTNYEVGLKWSGRGGKLNATFSAYRVEEENIAVWVGSSTLFPNTGSTICCYSDDGDYTRVSKGVDLELQGELLPGWNIAASYTWNNNVEKGEDNYSEGDPMQSRFPKHNFKLWNTYRFQTGEWMSRLSISAGVVAKSRAYYAGTACQEYSETGSCTGGNQDFEFTQGFYAVTSARVAYQFSDNWLLSLNVGNVFDRRYWETVGNSRSGNYYGEPRNYTLGLRGKF